MTEHTTFLSGLFTKGTGVTEVWTTWSVPTLRISFQIPAKRRLHSSRFENGRTIIIIETYRKLWRQLCSDGSRTLRKYHQRSSIRENRGTLHTHDRAIQINTKKTLLRSKVLPAATCVNDTSISASVSALRRPMKLTFWDCHVQQSNASTFDSPTATRTMLKHEGRSPRDAISASLPSWQSENDTRRGQLRKSLSYHRETNGCRLTHLKHVMHGARPAPLGYSAYFTDEQRTDWRTTGP